MPRGVTLTITRHQQGAADVARPELDVLDPRRHPGSETKRSCSTGRRLLLWHHDLPMCTVALGAAPTVRSLRGCTNTPMTRRLELTNLLLPMKDADTYVRDLARNVLGTDNLDIDVTYITDDDGLTLATGTVTPRNSG
jgi:hypothetical protein